MKNKIGRPKNLIRKDKAIIARVPAELWEFVMHHSISTQTSMTAIVENLLTKWRNKIEGKKEKKLVNIRLIVRRLKIRHTENPSTENKRLQ